MKQQHPLCFFFSLTDTNRLYELKREFYAGADDDNYEQTVDQTNESRRVTYFDSVQGWQETEYFSDYLTAKLEEEVSIAFQQLDLLLLGESNLKRLEVSLVTLQSSLDILSKKAKTDKQIAQYPAILEALSSLSEYMMLKAQAMKAPTVETIAKSTTKLQWLGQINVLGTLFYHLHKGQDGGKPYISGTAEQIKRMLIDNFIDSDGHDLSKSTLDTIFTLNKHEKRAKDGDRIELPNKKSKKETQ